MWYPPGKKEQCEKKRKKLGLAVVTNSGNAPSETVTYLKLRFSLSEAKAKQFWQTY